MTGEKHPIEVIPTDDFFIERTQKVLQKLASGGTSDLLINSDCTITQLVSWKTDEYGERVPNLELIETPLTLEEIREAFVEHGSDHELYALMADVQQELIYEDEIFEKEDLDGEDYFNWLEEQYFTEDQEDHVHDKLNEAIEGAFCKYYVQEKLMSMHYPQAGTCSDAIKIALPSGLSPYHVAEILSIYANTFSLVKDTHDTRCWHIISNTNSRVLGRDGANLLLLLGCVPPTHWLVDWMQRPQTFRYYNQMRAMAHAMMDLQLWRARQKMNELEDSLLSTVWWHDTRSDHGSRGNQYPPQPQVFKETAYCYLTSLGWKPRIKERYNSND